MGPLMGPVRCVLHPVSATLRGGRALALAKGRGAGLLLVRGWV